MICWLENHSNDRMSSLTYVFYLSTISSRNSGMYLKENNFRHSISIYTARRISSKHLWVDHEDLYLVPSKKTKSNTLLDKDM
jgi:hypothetical protein